jgi:hypothetical protein
VLIFADEDKPRNEENRVANGTRTCTWYRRSADKRKKNGTLFGFRRHTLSCSSPALRLDLEGSQSRASSAPQSYWSFLSFTMAPNNSASEAVAAPPTMEANYDWLAMEDAERVKRVDMAGWVEATTEPRFSYITKCVGCLNLHMYPALPHPLPR